jgi:large subunit ribosomal protein L19e
VWINPERLDDVEGAITREEIKKLIREKVISSLPEKGVSRARAKVIRGKKRKGRRKGPGSYGGSGYAKVSRKEMWMSKIRSLRKRLRELKASRIIAETTYTQYYRMAGSGRFESVADLERYLKAHDLWRKR